MNRNLIKIYFYFPEKSLRLENKQKLVDFILKSMRKDGMIDYAGYSDKKKLRTDLLRRIGNYKANLFKRFSKKEKNIIKKTIYETIKKCNKILPLPTKNFIFVFPWFPPEKEKIFNGSFGFAAYSCVLHLFVSPGFFTTEAIANSVAHEINHTISYYHRFERYGNWSLLDHIINEGLAENFREDVFKNTKVAPWATALTKKEAFSILKSIKSLLNSKSQNIHKRVLMGDKKYKRWTGYSIGYWIVKEFKNQKKMTWEKIIKTTPEEILKSVMEKGCKC